MEKRFRAHFINSLSGFKSANLIATENSQQQSNLAIFSSVIHLGASPALVGFITRPDSVARHTLNNIKETKQYTINQISHQFYPQAHQTSARYSADECEFLQTGLTKQYIENIAPPFVAESHLKYALTLEDIIPLPLNGTQLVIGRITDIICPHEAIQPDGYIDIEQLGAACISGLDSYHNTSRLSRLSYAKPTLPVQELTTTGVTVTGVNNDK